MAQETKEEKKDTEDSSQDNKGKKKGKLPLILIIVIAVLGVGFFMMKKSGPSEPPPIELGKVQDLDEFLVNLKDGRTYLRAKVSLHLVKDFKEEEFKNLLPAVRDAIILVLSSTTLQEANTLKGKEDLKVEIAEEVNEILKEGGPKLREEKPRRLRPHRKTVEHPDWDSQIGPVLKVYYTDFATQ